MTEDHSSSHPAPPAGSQEAALLRALERERQARKEAERLLEEKSLELFLRNEARSMQAEQRDAPHYPTRIEGQSGLVANTMMRKLSLVVQKVQVAVIITDATGRIEWINDNFTRMTGYEAHEAIGQTPGLLLQGVDTEQDTVRRIRESLSRGEAFSEEMLNYRKDGSPFWMSMNVSPIRDENGKLVQWISINEDITERRREQASIERAKTAAESANKAKDEFLANMSHEIRTPLTAILGYAEILDAESGIPGPMRRDALQSIRKNGQHLVNIINEILDLSKIEAGRLEVEKVRFSPRDLLTEIVTVMRGQALTKRLPLELDFVGNMPQTIETDPLRLRQILMNLISNAIKFTEDGEVRVLVRVRHMATGSARFQIDVIDTGVGIRPEVMERIFDPFAQEDSSTTRRFGGTGLGLAISIRLAKLLGGTIDVQSKPGAGSCFTVDIDAGRPDEALAVELPISELPRMEMKFFHDRTRAPEASLPEASAPQIPGAQIPGAGARRILVVDDAPENQRLIEFKIKRLGYDVDIADEGQSGYQSAMQAMRSRNPYRCILLDMQMPVMDGYETARKLRAEKYDYPIVALTANAMRGEREKCIAAGCDDYVSKPIDFDELEQVIDRLEKQRFADVP